MRQLARWKNPTKFGIDSWGGPTWISGRFRICGELPQDGGRLLVETDIAVTWDIVPPCAPSIFKFELFFALSSRNSKPKKESNLVHTHYKRTVVLCCVYRSYNLCCFTNYNYTHVRSKWMNRRSSNSTYYRAVPQLSHT